MLHADEIQNGPAQIQFSMTLVEAAHVSLEPEVVRAERLSSGRRGELDLSGFQVLVGCISVLCTACVLLALIRLWLFEQ